jgi:hypothetical protein
MGGIGVGPLFVNTAGGLVISLVAIAVHYSHRRRGWLAARLLGLLVSIAMPSARSPVAGPCALARSHKCMPLRLLGPCR